MTDTTAYKYNPSGNDICSDNATRNAGETGCQDRMYKKLVFKQLNHFLLYPYVFLTPGGAGFHV